MTTRIIAEIGFNHGGDMEQARLLIKAAAAAGAHAVKFQSFRADDIALPNSPHFALIESGEMSEEEHFDLAALARQSGVDFLSTPFGDWAVDMLEKIGVSEYKIASMDLDNTPLLDRVAATGKAVHLSTGMATLAEIATAVEFLQEHGAGEISLLHCVSKYPPSADELNLATIPRLKAIFGLPVGYSDHFPGVSACLAAFWQGAEIIETHFTLDNTRPEADHPHSADPKQLRWLVDEIKRHHAMIGRADLSVTRPDRPAAEAMRRGIHYARDMKAGERIGPGDVVSCRPVSEFSPRDLRSLMGRTLKTTVARDAPVNAKDLI